MALQMMYSTGRGCRIFSRWQFVFFCLVLHVLILLHGIQTGFPNIDELAHLPAGVAHWKFERFDMYRVNPPLVRIVAGLPAWFAGTVYNWDLYSAQVGCRPEFTIGLERLERTRLELPVDFTWPRIFGIVFSLLGVVVLTRWVYDVFGLLAANLACGFWCFCPNNLAYAQTIVPDVGAVAMGVAASLMCWKYARKPSAERALWGGAVVGTAILSKLTWITAVVSLPFTALICIQLFIARNLVSTWRGFGIQLIILSAMALIVLNLGYLFEGSGARLGEYEFCSEALGGPGSNPSQLGNRFSDTWLAGLPVPVPRNYLLGIDYLKYEVEAKRWSFLMGEWKFGSWPHYYVMTTLFKTPEPTLLAALIGLGVLVVGIRRKMVEPKVISMFLFLAIPAGVCFASVSLQGGFNHHHRYVLMIYPCMFALAAYVASPVAVQLLRFRLPLMGPTKRSIAIPLAVTLVVLSAASSLRVHPYYTSYFNTLSGGPENGWRLLGFSNIDWGQDILEVDKWLKAHPDRRPLVMDLDYFGMNGKLFDVPTSDPPQLPKHASIDEVRSSITETQWWIISVKKLYNYPGHHGLEYLQQLEPVDKIAYAYHVYRIDPLPPLEPATDALQESDHVLGGTPATPCP
jgi:hypothetical protein